MARTPVNVHKIATLEGHKDSVYALTGDSNGNIYSSGGDGLIAKWDLSKPKDAELSARVESSVYALKVDEECGMLLIGHNHEGLHIVDPVNREEVKRVPLVGCKAIFDIQVFQKTYFILTESGILFTYDSQSEKLLRTKVAAHSLRSLFVTPDYIYIAVSDGTVRVLNHQFDEVEVLAVGEKSIFGICSLTSGDWISVSRDCHLKRFDVKNQLKKDVVAHMYAINSIAFAPGNHFFATASMDKTIKIWEAQDVQLLKVIDKERHNGHSNSVNRLFWSRYNNLLVSCSDDRTLGVWDLKIGI